VHFFSRSAAIFRAGVFSKRSIFCSRLVVGVCQGLVVAAISMHPQCGETNLPWRLAFSLPISLPRNVNDRSRITEYRPPLLKYCRLARRRLPKI
jgi:hypothetical protein